MNPLLMSTVVSSILGLKRTCPKCKKDQVVPSSKRKKTVRCKFCDDNIPPRKDK